MRLIRQRVRQQLSARVVVPEGPRRVQCVELELTFFANGDWEVVGPAPSMHLHGGEDTFERTMARLVLGIGSAYAIGAA
jgi:hypothetical protein